MAKRGKVRVVDALHVPTSKTRENVIRLVACGLEPMQIAFVLGCMEHEVREHYADELEHGTAVVVAAVGNAMVKNALRGDTIAQRSFLQMRGRWTVPQHVELTGKDGGPIQMEARRALIGRVLALVVEQKPEDKAGQTIEGEGTELPVQ